MLYQYFWRLLDIQKVGWDRTIVIDCDYVAWKCCLSFRYLNIFAINYFFREIAVRVKGDMQTWRWFFVVGSFTRIWPSEGGRCKRWNFWHGETRGWDSHYIGWFTSVWSRAHNNKVGTSSKLNTHVLICVTLHTFVAWIAWSSISMDFGHTVEVACTSS